MRDAFFTMPGLTRLKQPDLIRRTIADGVLRGDIGYARKTANDQLELVAFNKPLAEADVEIGDDVVILRADDARKLLEPPRLVRIQISPDGKEVAPGDMVMFAASGVSQYGDVVEPGIVTWVVSGGSIDETGKFVAGKQTGSFTITARCGAVESSAQLRIRSHEQNDEEREPSGGQMIGWSGEVPPQKWMNFYTKVLTRFASTPGLRLQVAFQVPTESAQAKVKADEARAALRELGLNDELNEV